VPTHDWTLDSLDARIAEIRQQYLAALGEGAPALSAAR